MKSNQVSVLVVLLLCLVMGGFLYVVDRSSDDEKGWTPSELYSELGARSYEGSSFSDVTFSGGGNSDGVAVSMRNGSFSLRTRARHVSSPNNLIANGAPAKSADFWGALSPHRLIKPIYIETRNFHDYSKWRNIFEANGFAYQPHLNYHVDTTSLDQVQSRIGKHRWRYIRLSMRDGAKIVDHPTLEQVRAFYTILQDLYRTKVRTPLWSWEFFERLFHTEHARYILVELDGQIVGGTACVCLPGKAVYEWYACGLDNCRDDIRPLSVAIWGEMRYAAENGYPLFDFMGAGTPDQPYGVRDFKAEFGGELVEHGRFLCVRKPLLYWIGKMGVKWLRRK